MAVDIKDAVRQFVTITRQNAEAETATINPRTSCQSTAGSKSKPQKKKSRTEYEDSDCDDAVTTAFPPKRSKFNYGGQPRHATSSQPVSAGRRLPQRKTKTWEERKKMLKAHKPVDNFVPELPVKTFNNWTEFQTALERYEAEFFLHYRIRSSETREKHNR